MPTMIIKAAAVALTAVGVPGGVVSIAAPIIGNGLVSLGLTVGLNAIAQSQVPDPESGKLTRRQPRPERVVLMGGGSRGGGAYLGSDRA